MSQVLQPTAATHAGKPSFLMRAMIGEFGNWFVPTARRQPLGEGATTLEWSLSSPPPFHQFIELPRVRAD